MINRKRLVYLVIFTFFASVLHAVTYNTISPSKKVERTDNVAAVVIQVHPSGAKVYINDTYHGTSDVTVKNLSSGNYKLRVEKEGYETGYYKIQAKKGYTYTYSVSLKKITGFISVTGLSSDGLLYIDGFRRSSRKVEVDVGSHNVRARLFGYEDFNQTVYVKPYATETVTPKFKPAAFRISDFKVSKTKINPEYSNGFGRCEFSFEVTSNGSADVYVCDESANIVWYNRFDSFSTWSQSCTWKGTNNSGDPVPDGVYTAILSDYNDYSEEVEIVVDRGMNYPVVNYTKSGSGTGNVAAAFPVTGTFRVPFISVMPVFDVASKKYHATGLNAGFFADFAGCMELGFSGDVFFVHGTGDTQFDVNANIKYTKTIPLSENSFLGIALFGRYGFSGNQFLMPYGTDTGCGLGGGAAVGFDSSKYYFGVTSEYVFGADTGILTENAEIWKNSVLLNFKISRTSVLGIWAALHSSFGVHGDDYMHAKEAGVDFSFMPGSSAAIMTFKLNAMMIDDSKIYAGGQFGLSYLF